MYGLKEGRDDRKLSNVTKERFFFKSYLFVIMCVCGGGAVHVQVVPTQSRRGCPIPGVGLAG